jgi:hypothetical protein
VWRNNTIYDAGAGCGAWLMGSGASTIPPRGQNEVYDNIFEDGSCVASGILAATGNVVATEGNPCSWNTGTNHVSGWTPNWNGTDFASAGQSATYQPTNLPTGYESAGYQPAPFGPDACHC